MNNNKPRVSVLMAVYNGSKYFKQAIDSILNQTFSDYEFIIINDGSTDNSADIVKSYRDHRIKFINNEVNLGLPTSLNKGIDLAAGEYIVRMDCDDISIPTRIEKQVNFMDMHPEVGVSGTWIKHIGVSWQPWKSTIYKFPLKHRQIKARSLFSSSLSHPSAIMRKSLLEKYQLRYNPEHHNVEDFGFWQKCILYFVLANIPEALLLYRVNPGSITQSNRDRGLKAAHDIIRLNIHNQLGIDFFPEERLIGRLDTISFTKTSLIKFYSWLQTLQKANSVRKIYPEPEFTQALSEQWAFACYRSSGLRIKDWFLFWHMPLSRALKLNVKQILKFFLKFVGVPSQKKWKCL